MEDHQGVVLREEEKEDEGRGGERKKEEKGNVGKNEKGGKQKR